MEFCVKCGERAEVGDKYCNRCGAELHKDLQRSPIHVNEETPASEVPLVSVTADEARIDDANASDEPKGNASEVLAGMHPEIDTSPEQEVRSGSAIVSDSNVGPLRRFRGRRMILVAVIVLAIFAIATFLLVNRDANVNGRGSTISRSTPIPKVVPGPTTPSIKTFTNFIENYAATVVWRRDGIHVSWIDFRLAGRWANATIETYTKPGVQDSGFVPLGEIAYDGNNGWKLSSAFTIPSAGETKLIHVPVSGW